MPDVSDAISQVVKNGEGEEDEEMDVSDIIGLSKGSEDGEDDKEGLDALATESDVDKELSVDSDGDGIEDFMQNAYIDSYRHPITGQYMGRPAREERASRDPRAPHERAQAYVPRSPRETRPERPARTPHVPSNFSEEEKAAFLAQYEKQDALAN